VYWRSGGSTWSSVVWFEAGRREIRRVLPHCWAQRYENNLSSKSFYFEAIWADALTTLLQYHAIKKTTAWHSKICIIPNNSITIKHIGHKQGYMKKFKKQLYKMAIILKIKIPSSWQTYLTGKVPRTGLPTLALCFYTAITSNI